MNVPEHQTGFTDNHYYEQDHTPAETKKECFSETNKLETGHSGDTPIEGENTAHDVFGSEDGHAIKYRTLSWQLVAILMIAEIVSNGMLSLPYALAAIGLVPGIIVIAFLGIWATYTSWLLVNFKLRHPNVHSMGDAGYIIAGPIGREVLAFGTVVFAILASGSQLVAGQIALGILTENKICLMAYTGIFAAATLVLSFPRTLDKLGWLSIPSVISIMAAGVIGMVIAALQPTPNHTWSLTKPNSFYNSFTAVTNPVFAYAGHFMFFILISEMKKPQDAMKAAYTLQIFATCFYIAFAVVAYIYLGDMVASPSLISLPPLWSKIAFGVAIPNFLIAGALYSHTASKLFFVRFFRNSRHLHSHTFVGWATWTVLILVTNGAAFVLAVGVPIFNYVVGLGASLFASWYTYGIAGAFWLHDVAHDGSADAKGTVTEARGMAAWWKKPFQATLAIATFVGGLFICVAGMYVTIRGIKEAYASGAVGKAFAC